MSLELSPRRPDLKGTCREAVEELVKKDPTLTAVGGWYIDAAWGPQEHWWATTPTGQIVDPTVEQFPTGHIPSLRQYEPFDGFGHCEGCGIRFRADLGAEPICCGACYGSMVGVFVGICTCTEPDETATAAPDTDLEL